ncbi:sigma-70 family RNA polymerase sigma factor [bacterium]|nr:sigma-70 family RNA polymerase sigma factor [bacterium]
MTVRNLPVPPEFTQLVVEQHQQLRSFVRTLGVDPDWVDDLAQEAFMVAWRERDTFDQQRDFGKWLRGIARNLVRNEIRKQHRHQRLLHQGLAELLSQHTDTQPERETWKACRVPVLRDCVEQLAPKSRELVSGRYGDGWKAPDLADHFGMTPMAVRQALARIRRQLKQCIEQRTVVTD